MLLVDELNDINQIFSDSANASDRVQLTIDKWGAEWIVFPNSVTAVLPILPGHMALSRCLNNLTIPTRTPAHGVCTVDLFYCTDDIASSSHEPFLHGAAF